MRYHQTNYFVKLCLILSSFLVNMQLVAQVYVQTATVWQVSTSTSVSTTFTSTSTSGNLIIVHVDWDNQARSISTIIDSKGNTYRRINGPTNWNGVNYRAELWYAYNIIGGGAAIKVTATLTGAPTTHFQIYISEYRYIYKTDPLDKNKVAIGNAAVDSSGSVTTTSSKELIYGISIGSNGNLTGNVSYNQRSNANQNVIEDQIVTSIGTYNTIYSAANTPANFWISQIATFFGSGALPVELLDFSAKTNDNNTATLNWSTASEINNDYFTIEKTVDDINYEIVAKVNGAGNSDSQINYEAIDANPTNGISKYRLTQTDFNGNSETFKLVPLDFKRVSNLDFSVFPNPSDGSTITLFSPNENIGKSMDIYLMDAYGRTISERTFIVTEQSMNLRQIFSTPKLNSGLYLIVGILNNKEYTSRLAIFE